MKTLFLFRHGVAEDAAQAGGSDKARRLTPAGREEMVAAARGIKRLNFEVEAVWTSPYPRASETAEIAHRELGLKEGLREVGKLASGAEPATIAGLLRDVDADYLMLVGHNPDFEIFAAYMISSRGDARIKLGKGGLAVFSMKASPGPGSATLTGLWRAEHLALLGNSGN